jgi:hypothetical protein
VVNFTWNKSQYTGILAPDGDIAAYHPGEVEGSFGISSCTNITPTGQKIAGLTTWTSTLNALPTIFAKPSFKVGDMVKVTESMCSIHVGDTAIVDKIMSDGKIKLRGSGEYDPAWIELAAPTFTGTYAERQAQWIEHHGLKVGSKVRVVRKFDEDEDGFDGHGWDSCNDKIKAQGQIHEISSIRRGQIKLNQCNYYPYFALEPA